MIAGATPRLGIIKIVAMVDNHGAMNTGLGINNALYGVTGTTLGANAGIRHTF